MARTARQLSVDQEEREEHNAEIVDRPNPPHRLREDIDMTELFTMNGRPARFHLKTLGLGRLTPGEVEALSIRITEHGGEITDREESADTILVHLEGVDTLRRKYWDSRTVWVEELKFVRICINTKQYEKNLSKPMRKGMGGRPGGYRRVAFTPEDDRHLCEFLASVIPDAEAGGRFGPEIYRRLVASSEEFRHRRWAARHTAWSWLERYRNRHAILDPIINILAEENPPRPDGKGLYERTRFLNPKKQLYRIEDFEVSGEEEEDDSAADVEQALLGDGRKRGHSAGDDDEQDDEEERSKRARHTDDNLRSSPVEQGRRARTPASGRAVRASLFEIGGIFDRSSDDLLPQDELLEVQFELDVDKSFELSQRSPDNRQIGPEDAGPSGTQWTSPARRLDTQGTPRSISQARPRPRHAYRGTHPSEPHRPSQATTSSQATLVGTAQQQRESTGAEQDKDDRYAGPTQVQQPDDAPAADAAIKSSQSHLIHSAPIHESRTRERSTTGENAPQVSQRVDVDAPSRSNTSGDAEEVENTLGDASQKRHPFEDIDSDDERTHLSLLSAAREAHASPQASIQRSARSTFSLRAVNNPMATPSGPHAQRSRSSFAVLTDISGGAMRSLSLKAASYPANVAVSASQRPPSTPVNSFGQAAERGTITSDSDSVPLQGTRAREERSRKQDEQARTTYTPATGTRAASNLSLRSRRIPRVG
ncbi:uncharacterized protein LAESUDRAFT_746988 [Laetiporus sulphureus 93-53]|uniref:BRCT domain-containing protein n=1 Tax=Laetiporus sulphureus 93-53 TaxID=1314785 RepID=A0A165H2Z1_9APHY|nr:uncharacterized protein LAESUDRAFT_746988 [Laetiporus sulphureus 93-53]KZT11173.1 hypothetical protein LAESUDRAFT_746988 [Laetiporus sulphureus 93-53]